MADFTNLYIPEAGLDHHELIAQHERNECSSLFTTVNPSKLDSPADSEPSILHDEKGLPIRTGHLFGGALTDGETVWYCSICEDGPYGSWQPVCQNCSHQKCGSCTVVVQK
ncbi:hypothetical protein BKA66DRAFT_471395 [Pyrenochaeta sp. MPI-SDFR-AT-0127]|nr:hypothetical protein BKA66DRAFT_471395 [Pyrenochaeta sp. MPI-SDFR-AT-0127]